MIHTLSSWLSAPRRRRVLGRFSVVAVVASVVLVPRFLAKLPADLPALGSAALAFDAAARLAQPARHRAGAARIAMLLLPGQGVLTLLVGVLLVDFRASIARRALAEPAQGARARQQAARTRGSPPLTLTRELH
jgi:hypothetical protein